MLELVLTRVLPVDLSQAPAPRRATRSAGKSTQRLGIKSSGAYGSKSGGPSGRKAASGRSGAGLGRGLSGVADERGTGLGDKLLDRDYQRSKHSAYLIAFG
jgi:hypothetical protein